MSATPKSTLPLWRNRDYLLLFSGQTVSQFGTGISQLVYPLLVLTLTRSAVQAALIGALAFLPQLLFGLVAGALVDRWDRKRVMIICDVGRAGILALLALLLALKVLPIPLLYFLVPAEGTLAIFFSLCATARLPHVVTAEQLPTAVAQDQMALAVTSLFSPFFGGLLYSVAAFFPFLVDALSYLLSAVSLVLMQTAFQKERTQALRPLSQEIGDGLLWLWQQPLMRSLTLLIAAVVFVGSSNSLLLILLAQSQHASAAIIGVMFSLTGLGSILGSLVAIPIQRRLRFGHLTICGCWGFVLCWPCYAIAHIPLALGAVGALLSLISAILDVALFSYRLALIPDELRGRISSVTKLLILGSRSLGLVMAGFLLQHLGIFPSILLFWGWLFIAAVGATLTAPLRQAPSLPKATS
jgi:MFS family permease